MKLLLRLLLLFLSVKAVAQSPEKTIKIVIGYNFSPDYSFRTLEYGDGNSSIGMVVKSRNDLEKAKFGYTTGFSLTIHFSGLFAFETGIQYANKGYNTKEQDVTYAQPDPSLPNKVTIIYSYQYIGIPLQAKFTFGKNKTRFIASAGFTTNFLLNAKQSIHLKFPDGKTEEQNQSSTSGFNTIEISPTVSTGIDYTLTNKIHVSAAPTFRFGLNKIINAPIEEKLWSVGLAFGISYVLE